MICENILKYEYVICAAQCMFLAALYLLKIPAVFFMLAQFGILFLIYYHNSKFSDAAAEKQSLIFLMALIFAMPFIGCFFFRLTLKSSPASAAIRGQLKNEIESYIKNSADYEKNLTYRHAETKTLKTNAVPIIDILSGEDIGVKRKSVTILTRMRSPRAVKLLKQALQDQNVEIKFMAATALLKIENNMRDRIIKLTEEVEEMKAAGTGINDTYLKRFELAESISMYIHSGLPDKSNSGEYYDRMFNELEFINMRKPDFLQAGKFLASEYALRGNYGRALEIIEALLKEPAIFQEVNEKLKIESIILFCEIHYNLKNFDKINEICFNSKKYFTGELIQKMPEFKDFYNSIMFFAEHK